MLYILWAAYPEQQEADYFTQQVGVFEIHQGQGQGHGKVMRQVMLHAPIHWCPELQTQPMAVMGNYTWSVTNSGMDHPRMSHVSYDRDGPWQRWLCVHVYRGDVEAQIAVYVSSTNGTDGAFLALRVDQGCCTTFLAKGVFFWILYPSKTFRVTRDLSECAAWAFLGWYTYSLHGVSIIQEWS